MPKELTKYQETVTEKMQEKWTVNMESKYQTQTKVIANYCLITMCDINLWLSCLIRRDVRDKSKMTCGSTVLETAWSCWLLISKKGNKGCTSTLQK